MAAQNSLLLPGCGRALSPGTSCLWVPSTGLMAPEGLPVGHSSLGGSERTVRIRPVREGYGRPPGPSKQRAWRGASPALSRAPPGARDRLSADRPEGGRDAGIRRQGPAESKRPRQQVLARRRLRVARSGAPHSGDCRQTRRPCCEPDPGGAPLSAGGWRMISVRCGRRTESCRGRSCCPRETEAGRSRGRAFPGRPPMLLLEVRHSGIHSGTGSRGILSLS